MALSALDPLLAARVSGDLLQPCGRGVEPLSRVLGNRSFPVSRNLQARRKTVRKKAIFA